MNELHRMQYLDAMGIEMFVPRKILPAAKASAQCAVSYLPQSTGDGGLTASLPKDLAVNAQASLQPKAQPKSLSRLQSSLQSNPAEVSALNAALNDVVSKKQPEEQQPAKQLRPPSAAPNLRSVGDVLGDPQGAPQASSADQTLQQFNRQKKTKLLRFNLSVWAFDNGAVFIDSHEPRAALPTTTLLRNIIAAIMPGVLTGNLPKPDTLAWPIDELGVPNSRELEQAREMTQAYIASRFAKTQPKRLFLMGESAFNMLAFDSADTTTFTGELPDYGAVLTPSHLPCRAVYLPSLAQLLNEPLLKRFIWQAIAPEFLIAELSAHADNPTGPSGK